MVASTFHKFSAEVTVEWSFYYNYYKIATWTTIRSQLMARIFRRLQSFKTERNLFSLVVFINKINYLKENFWCFDIWKYKKFLKKLQLFYSCQIKIILEKLFALLNIHSNWNSKKVLFKPLRYQYLHHSFNMISS